MAGGAVLLYVVGRFLSGSWRPGQLAGVGALAGAAIGRLLVLFPH